MRGLCILKGSDASTLSWNAENFQGILLQGAAELKCVFQQHIVFCACPDADLENEEELVEFVLKVMNRRKEKNWD